MTTMGIKVDAIKQWLLRKKRENAAKTESALPKRFEVIADIGSGATARVFRVRDKILNEERAVKKYFPGVDPITVRTELSILREVRSPYVVSAYDVISDDNGGLCLVMDYIRGRSLETILQSGKQMSSEDIDLLADELFAAIESLHPNFTRIDQLKQLPELDDLAMREYLNLRDSGYLHRDIKPSNIVIEDERSWRCKLVDLGLARPAKDAGHTRVGTEAYVPPDWGGARWDATFDLYAIGVILYRAVFGQFPSRSDDGSIVQTTCPNDKASALSAFFERALAPDHCIRFQNVDQMREAFREGAQDVGSSVRPQLP